MPDEDIHDTGSAQDVTDAAALGDTEAVAAGTPKGPRAGLSRMLDPDWWDAPHIGIAAVLFGVLIAVAIMGVRCISTSGPAYSHPSVDVVSEALRLRRDLSTDAKAYAVLFESSAVATELAAVSEAATSSPIPDWEAPYVSEVGTATTDVVVVWVRDPDKPDFPAAVIFTTRLGEAGWRITDARNATDTPPPPMAGE